MATKKVISVDNFPARLPLERTALVYLILDKFNAAGWVWGSVGLLYLLIWLVAIKLLIEQEKVDIFKTKDYAK